MAYFALQPIQQRRLRPSEINGKKDYNNMKKKKLLVILLILCLALAAFGCSMGGNVDEDGNIVRNQDSFTVTIVGGILNGLFQFTEMIGLPSFALAIFLLTLIVKLLTHPVNVKQQKSMKSMSVLQPEMKKINEKYANNPEKRQEATMKLYREHKINPMSSCLPLLIQLPILMILFYGMRNWIPDQSLIDAGYYGFLWINDLSQMVANTKWPYLLPLVCALTTLLQQSMSIVNLKDRTQMMMLVIFPVMFFFVARQFPAGLALYWIFYGLLTAVQSLFINFRLKTGIFTPAEERLQRKEAAEELKEQRKEAAKKQQEKAQAKQQPAHPHTHSHESARDEKNLPDKPWK